MFHCIHFFLKGKYLILDLHQSINSLIFSNGKKQGMGLNSHKNPDLFPPPKNSRRRPDLFPRRPPFFFRRSHGHFGLGDPKGLESYGELAPHNSPSQFGNPTTPRLHGNAQKKTFRKSCCCCWTGMLGNLLNSEYIDIFEVPDQYSAIFYGCTWMRPKSFCKIHLHELELGINLDIVHIFGKISAWKTIARPIPLMLHLHLATSKLLGDDWRWWCCVEVLPVKLRGGGFRFFF